MEEKELEIYPKTIDEAVEELIRAREKGEHVYFDWNDTRLHSDDVTLDSAYIAIVGRTREQYLEELKKQKEEMEKRHEELLERIPKVVEKGYIYISTSKREKWAKAVDKSFRGMYEGFDIEAALEIMKSLDENKNIEDSINLFYMQGHSGQSINMVRNIVLRFADRGPEFYKATAEKELTPTENAFLLDYIQENKLNHIITKEKVLLGLKYIAQNPNVEYTEMVNDLKKLDVKITFDDIKEQFPEQIPVFEGLKIGNISSGATVIANVLSSEISKSYVEDRFLSVDDETSIYHFIRVKTGDESYTKENIEALKGDLVGKLICTK